MSGDVRALLAKWVEDQGCDDWEESDGPCEECVPCMVSRLLLSERRINIYRDGELVAGNVRLDEHVAPLGFSARPVESEATP